MFLENFDDNWNSETSENFLWQRRDKRKSDRLTILQAFKEKKEIDLTVKRTREEFFFFSVVNKDVTFQVDFVFFSNRRFFGRLHWISWRKFTATVFTAGIVFIDEQNLRRIKILNFLNNSTDWDSNPKTKNQQNKRISSTGDVDERGERFS